MKAAVYVRVSREEQLENWSISAQTREAEDYCKQKGRELLQIYSEEGVSAHSDSISKRPQFRKLLDDCKRHDYDVIVVHSLDRWSRNLGVTLESFKRLAESRISFASISENIDYSTPEGRLFIAMLGAFAQYFSDNLGKHTSKGMKERAVNGLPNGDIPFGYRRDPADSNAKKGVILCPEEAEAVKKVFQMYAAGGHSLASMAEYLNENGFRTRNKRHLPDGNGARLFTSYSVRWILHNAFYTGMVKYKGKLYQGNHQGIIDSELFDRVQARLKSARSRSKTYSPKYKTYLLKGLARCIYCGYPLWSETSKGYSYYREPVNSSGHLNCLAKGKTISGRIIDQQLDALIKSLVLLPSWKEKILEKLSALSDRERIFKQRILIEAKLKRLGKAYIDGLVTEGDYNIQRVVLQDNLSSLAMPEVNAALNAGELLQGLSLIWDKATLEEKHKLLTTMLEAVYIDMVSSRSIVGIQPKAQFYPLFEALRNRVENKINVFNQGTKHEKGLELPSPSTVMVETGES